jgi:hypothetical protein
VRNRRAFLKRHARTLFTFEIGALASSLAYGSPLALPITLIGAAAVTAVAIWTREAEHVTQERAIRSLEEARRQEAAAHEPIHIGALEQVAAACSRVLRRPISRDGARRLHLRSADLSVLGLARGYSPQYPLTSALARQLQEGLEEITREYGAAIGAPVNELTQSERGAAYGVARLLEKAQDALDVVALTAEKLIGAGAFERGSNVGCHNDAITAFRAELQAVVRHAEVLLHAEHAAKGLENPVPPLLTR